MQQAPPSPIEQHPPRRILIVRLSAHGDVIHTLPLLAAIKQADPTAFVGWLVETSAASLLESHPQIDALHVSHRKRWMKALANPLRWPETLSAIGTFVRELRQQGYTISLDTQGLFKSAIWPAFAGIANRYGFKNTRESADLFYNHKLPPMNIRDASTPAIQRNLDFARTLGYEVGQPAFVLPPVSPQSRERVEAMLDRLHPEQPLVVLAPFTRWPSKHWQAKHWVELMQRLLDDGVAIALIGSPDNRPETEAMLAALPQPAISSGLPEKPQPPVTAQACTEQTNEERSKADHPIGISDASHQPINPASKQAVILNLAGETNWPDLYALFERTRLLVGLDSAPLHIANAAGIEVIGIYGPTAPGRTGPIGAHAQTLNTQLSCQPCFERDCPLKTHDCMQQMTPTQVMAAISQRLSADHSAVNA